MAYETGDTLRLVIEFYDDDGDPLVLAAAPTLHVIQPSGTTSSAVATQIGTTNVYYRDVVADGIGVLLWRGETADPLSSNAFTSWASENIEAAPNLPSLDDIVTSDFVIIQGDDYRLSENRAIVWDVSSSGFNLVGATVVAIWLAISYPMSISGRDLILELTSEQTIAMVVGNRHQYQVRVTLANTHMVTPVAGYVSVIAGAP
jgi:hypothetical protein